jgi:Predicted membrane protein (DUF2306)
MLYVHVAAGVIALSAGAVAMSAPKGGVLHRRAGNVFAGAMLVLTALGAVLAVQKPTYISVQAALLTFYLVCTAWLTVRHEVHESRSWIALLMTLGFGIGALGVYYAAVAAGAPSGRLDGIPAGGYLPFTFIAFAAALLDARLLRAGSIQGAARLTRHLWRMGLAMLIATLSLFLGQARMFPDAVRELGVLPLPVIATAAFFLYWLVRVRRRARTARALP